MDGINWSSSGNAPDTAAADPLVIGPIDDIEMDFAKLFDPAHEQASMQTEGSGWPRTISTTATNDATTNAAYPS